MDINKFKLAIKAREQTDDEWTEEVQKCQSNLVDIICEDMDSSIQYLFAGCTADEFSWLSEVFDDIVSRFPRKDFIESLRFLARKYPDETATYNIVPFIDSAEELLSELSER